jgi:hypothetical protein
MKAQTAGLRMVLLSVLVLAVAGARKAGGETGKGDGVLDVLFPGYAERKGGLTAYDSVRDRLVRFGGYGYPQGYPLTSEWDGEQWLPVHTAAVPPVERGSEGGYEMVFDAARSNIVLFGGYPAMGETWLYNGVTWTNPVPAHSPSARYSHQMVYDSARKRVVLFGGVPDEGANGFSDTWEWNGTDWQQASPAVSPAARKNHQMVFDAARGVSVLYKGEVYKQFSSVFWGWSTTNEMWEYNGTTWTNTTPPSFPTDTGPLAYNPARGKVELFGGLGSGNFNLWTYSGGAWSSQAFNSSPQGSGQTMDIDYASPGGTAVYVWSYVNYNDRWQTSHTWTWDGAQWTCRTPVLPPGVVTVFYSGESTLTDVNGDGWLDQVRAVNIRDLRNGDGEFNPGKALFLHDGTNLCATPTWTVRDNLPMTRVVVGDITGDGRPDAVFGAISSQYIEAYTNAGGTFSPTWDWRSSNKVVLASRAGMELVDVDCDGDLDLAALSRTTTNAALMVFINTAGTLETSPSVIHPLPRSSTAVDATVDLQVLRGSMAWADVDYDGQMECAVGYYYYDYISPGPSYHVEILSFTGAGFVSLLRLDDVTTPLAFADVDVDGYPDLIATGVRPGMWGGAGAMLFRNTGGAIGVTPSWTTAYSGAAVVAMDVGDFDGDGDPDVAVGHGDSGTSSLGHFLYRNDGGSFSPLPAWQSHELVGQDAQAGGSVQLADFDRDGVLDVVAGRGIYLLDRTLRDTVPPQAPRYAVGYAAPPGSSYVDVTWDPVSDPDVAAYRVYRGYGNSGDGHRLIGEVPATSTSYQVPFAAGGFEEYYVYAVDEAGNVGPWAKAETIGSLPNSRVGGDGRPDLSVSGKIMVGDATGDGPADIFTRRTHPALARTDYSWALYRNASAGTSLDRVWEQRWGANEPGTPRLLQDATGDGRADLLVSTSRMIDRGDGTNLLHQVLELWPSTGTGFSTSPVYSVVLPAGLASIGNCAWGDPDGDGDRDLVVDTYGSDRKAALFLNQGGTFATNPVWTSTANNIEAVAFGNLNNDGKDDLIIAEDIGNGGDISSLRLYVHQGTITGLSAEHTWADTTPGGGFNGWPVAVSWADFDRDGDQDVTLFSRAAAYGYRNTGGTLPPSTPPFSYSLLVTQSGNLGSKPAHDLLGWANIDGSGSLDLYGMQSVIRDAGSFTGPKVDDNYDTWKHLVTYQFRNLAVAYPWASVQSWFSDLVLAVDLTGDGIAELITDEANLIFLGGFPPSLPPVPVALFVLPPGPLMLDGPGDTLALTVRAGFDDGTTNDVTDTAVFEINQPDDGTKVICMSNNVVIAVNPSSTGPCRLVVTVGKKYIDKLVYVGRADHIPRALRVVPGAAVLTRPGEPLTFTAVATYDGGREEDVTPLTALTSDNPSSLAVTGNVAVALANGTANVTGMYRGLSGSAVVNVALSVGLSGLTMSPSHAALQAGARQGFEVRAHYGDGSSQVVTLLSAFASDAPGIASVSGSGVLGVSPGFAGVAGSYLGLDARATVAVDPASGPWIFEITGLEPAGVNQALNWYCTTPPGTTTPFTVWCRTNLLSGDWVPLGPSVPRHPFGFHTWTGGTNGAPTVFYRVTTP